MCDDGRKAKWFVKEDKGQTVTLECRACGKTLEATKEERGKKE